MEILKYPIGKFEAPKNITAQQLEDWIKTLEDFPAALTACVNGWTVEQLDTPYREGGWTVRQLIHHIGDSHINAMIRFKLGLTENNPKIKAYDQDAWSELSDYRALDASVSLSLIELVHIRLCSVLRGLEEADLKRTIFHPEMNKSLSLEKLLALYAWHSRHHLAQIIQLKKAKAW